MSATFDFLKAFASTNRKWFTTTAATSAAIGFMTSPDHRLRGAALGLGSAWAVSGLSPTAQFVGITGTALAGAALHGTVSGYRTYNDIKYNIKGSPYSLSRAPMDVAMSSLNYASTRFQSAAIFRQEAAAYAARYTNR